MRVLSEGNVNILHVMELHGVRRFVCMSSLGIGERACCMGLSYTMFVIPLILHRYVWDKARHEMDIAGSHMD